MTRFHTYQQHCRPCSKNTSIFQKALPFQFSVLVWFLESKCTVDPSYFLFYHLRASGFIFFFLVRKSLQQNSSQFYNICIIPHTAFYPSSFTLRLINKMSPAQSISINSAVPSRVSCRPNPKLLEK